MVATFGGWKFFYKQWLQCCTLEHTWKHGWILPGETNDTVE